MLPLDPQYRSPDLRRQSEDIHCSPRPFTEYGGRVFDELWHRRDTEDHLRRFIARIRTGPASLPLSRPEMGSTMMSSNYVWRLRCIAGSC